MDDEAAVVLLAVYPHDVLRNLTGNFGFISPQAGMLTLKPAFRIDAAGQLRLIPTLVLTEAEVDDYLRDPARFHPDDLFAWDGPEGGVELHFPYAWAVVKLLGNRRLWRGVRRGRGNTVPPQERHLDLRRPDCRHGRGKHPGPQRR